MLVDPGKDGQTRENKDLFVFLTISISTSWMHSPGQKLDVGYLMNKHAISVFHDIKRGTTYHCLLTSLSYSHLEYVDEDTSTIIGGSPTQHKLVVNTQETLAFTQEMDGA